jgi:hypothetical protein
MTRYVQDDNLLFNFQRSQLFLSLWGKVVPVDDISSTVPRVRLAVFKRRETFLRKLVGRFHAQDCEDNAFFVSKNPIFFRETGFFESWANNCLSLYNCLPILKFF